MDTYNVYQHFFFQRARTGARSSSVGGTIMNPRELKSITCFRGVEYISWQDKAYLLVQQVILEYSVMKKDVRIFHLSKKKRKM